VIAQVRRERPHHYLSVVASLLPRQLTVERTSVLGELSDEELDQLEQLLAAMRAKNVRVLNGADLDEKQQASFPLASPSSVDIK
jgi:hypothetical protein